MTQKSYFGLCLNIREEFVVWTKVSTLLALPVITCQKQSIRGGEWTFHSNCGGVCSISSSSDMFTGLSATVASVTSLDQTCITYGDTAYAFSRCLRLHSFHCPIDENPIRIQPHSIGKLDHLWQMLNLQRGHTKMAEMKRPWTESHLIEFQTD